MATNVTATTPARAPSQTRLHVGIAVAALGFLVLPFLIVRAPVETTMGIVQKIFYFHVPCALMLFLSAFACAGGSIAYLFKGSERGDRVALAAGELGVLFGLFVMTTGPLWGRVAWGVYWQWDARLTSSLLLWLMMIAYLLARRYGGPAARRLAAGLALFAAADVPLVYVSVNYWRTLHPKTTVVPSLGPGMREAFWFSFVVFLVLWGVLLALRLRLESARAALIDLEIAVDDAQEARSP